MHNKLVVASNTRFDAPPGRSLNAISMVRDVAYAPECLSKLDEMRVYAYNGVATDNFQVYHPTRRCCRGRRRAARRRRAPASTA